MATSHASASSLPSAQSHESDAGLVTLALPSASRRSVVRSARFTKSALSALLTSHDPLSKKSPSSTVVSIWSSGASGRLLRSRLGPAILIARSTASGVSAMDAITTTTSSSSRFCGNREPAPPLVACPKMTKANSPPCARNAPVTSDSRQVRPVTGPSAVMTPIFPAISPAVITATMGNRSSASGRSMVVPMVTKNRDRNSPLNARSSPMMSCAYGVPASTKPARNAPRESENPMAAVALENPNSTNSDSATNTSVPQSNRFTSPYIFSAAKKPK